LKLNNLFLFCIYYYKVFVVIMSSRIFSSESLLSDTKSNFDRSVTATLLFTEINQNNVYLFIQYFMKSDLTNQIKLKVAKRLDDAFKTEELKNIIIFVLTEFELSDDQWINLYDGGFIKFIKGDDLETSMATFSQLFFPGKYSTDLNSEEYSSVDINDIVKLYNNQIFKITNTKQEQIVQLQIDSAIPSIDSEHITLAASLKSSRGGITKIIIKFKRNKYFRNTVFRLGDKHANEMLEQYNKLNMFLTATPNNNIKIAKLFILYNEILGHVWCEEFLEHFVKFWAKGEYKLNRIANNIF